MKKIIFGTAILMGSFVSNSAYSQTENKCYTLQQNSNGETKLVLVKLVIQGNKVTADYLKDVVSSGSSVHVSTSKQGVVDGDKIVFTTAATEGTKERNAETTPTETWYIKDGSLLVGEDVLKPGGCN